MSKSQDALNVLHSTLTDAVAQKEITDEQAKTLVSNGFIVIGELALNIERIAVALEKIAAKQ